MKHTQQELESLSDCEINKLIGTRLFPKGWHICPSSNQNNTSGWIYSDYSYQRLDFVDLPDYCNEPAAIMPIQIKNNIELSPLFNGFWCASLINQYNYNGSPFYSLQAAYKNPCRAIAIVYIMMEQDKNE
jgi:hypothetical protein